MLIIGHEDVRQACAGRERELLEQVRAAYLAHHRGLTTVPPSSFLRLPGTAGDRIIALPAYVAADAPVAGIKWISSFPDNLEIGLPRASAAIVLNSLTTGRPEALLEASLISATRTAASAALAAELLTGNSTTTGVSLIGCGVINLEILRFLTVVFPALDRVLLHDLVPARAAAFRRQCRSVSPNARIDLAAELGIALGGNRLVSVATTAATPYTDLRACVPGTVVLHISLRDIEPATILAQRNVVDDADHVCREQTSVHLAEQLSGSRDFITASIGELLAGPVPRPSGDDRITIFSPFGLGALDMAVAGFVRVLAEKAGMGTTIPNFLPGPPDPAVS